MTKICSKCNQSNPSDASFCLNCASPLESDHGGPFVGQQNAGGFQQASTGQPSAASGSGQKATIALILAIVAFLCCGPFAGIPAAIVGWMELDAIKNGRSPEGGRWMALVGLWGGIAATLLHGVGYVLWVLLTAMAGAADPYGGYPY